MKNPSEYEAVPIESKYVKKLKLFFEGNDYNLPKYTNHTFDIRSPIREVNKVPKSSGFRRKYPTVNQSTAIRRMTTVNSFRRNRSKIGELKITITNETNFREKQNNQQSNVNTKENVKSKQSPELCYIFDKGYEVKTPKSWYAMNQTTDTSSLKTNNKQEPPEKSCERTVNQTEDENTIRKRALAHSLKNARISYKLRNADTANKSWGKQIKDRLVPKSSEKSHDTETQKRLPRIQTAIKKGTLHIDDYGTGENRNSRIIIDKKENEPRICDRNSIKNNSTFSGCSTDVHQPNYIQQADKEFKTKNKVQQVAELFESTCQASRPKSTNRSSNTNPISKDSGTRSSKEISAKVDRLSFTEGKKGNPPKGRLTSMITEEYRKSIIEQFDSELEQMRQDGFIDENENSAYFGVSCPGSSSSRQKNEGSPSDKMTEYTSPTPTKSYCLESDKDIGMDKGVNYDSFDNDEIAERTERQDNFENTTVEIGSSATGDGTRTAVSSIRMDSSPDQRTEGYSVRRLKQLFEINKPSTSSISTLPETKLEIHHHGNIREYISTPKNEYKKNSPKEELSQSEPKPPRDVSISSYNSRSFSDKRINQVLTRIKVDLEELNQIYESFEMKKKPTHESEDEQTEQYRQKVVQEIDQQLALLRNDGFLNMLRNRIAEQNTEGKDQAKKVVSQSREISSLGEGYENVSSPTEYSDAEEDSKENVDLEANGVANTRKCLADDLEQDLNTVEAYNDTMQKEHEEAQHEDTVIYANSDFTYKLIRDCEDEPLYESLDFIESDEKTMDQNIGVDVSDSDRSTTYSTNSSDNSSFDGDDGEIEMRRSSFEYDYVIVDRETFCDEKGVIRIERVAHCESPTGSCSSAESARTSMEKENSAASLTKLEYIIDEIKSTERNYVEGLKKVVTNFIPYIETRATDHLLLRHESIFDDVEQIYYRQKNFLAAIEFEDEINKIVECFLEHDQLFELYPNYFRKKQKADIVLEEYTALFQEMQEYFEDSLNFSAYLLTPVQRLGKYILFLENIEKELKKLDMPISNTQMALDIVKSEMSKGNDYVAIDSIQNSPISKLDYGSFKMQELFSIHKPKKMEAMVFIFTNVIVFATMEPNRQEIFNYYDSIKMDDLRIGTFENLTIQLTDHTKSKKKNNSSRYTYVLEAKTEIVWASWKKTIEGILWQQLYKVKEMRLNSAIPLKYETNKHQDPTKSTGSSIFYIE